MANPIVIERIIDSTPQEAFELFTQPERLRRWQAVSAGLDLRVGGDYRLTVTPGNVASGTYTEIEPGKRLVYTWGWEPDHGVLPGASTVDVDFEAVGDKTRVRLTHRGLDTDSAASHNEGWEHYADRLADAAAQGTAGPDPWCLGLEEYDQLTAVEASWHLCHNMLLNVTADDREKPTPCAEFTLHDLVEHLMGSVRSLGGTAGAEIPEEIEAVSAEDYLAQAVEPALAAWRSRGPDGEVQFFGQPMPASLPLGILNLEFLVHAWDFAQSIGQTVPAPEHLVAFTQAQAEAIIQPDNRGDGKGFANATTASSNDPLAVLAAFTGRTA